MKSQINVSRVKIKIVSSWNEKVGAKIMVNLSVASFFLSSMQQFQIPTAMLDLKILIGKANIDFRTYDT
jgi:hypothetical protein